MTRLVRAEFYKLRTTPGPWVLVGICAVLTGLFLIGIFANPHRHTGVGPTFAAPAGVTNLREFLGIGLQVALVLSPIAVVLCITGEYRHRVLTTTLLVTPRRPDVLVAKAVASMAWGLLLGVTSLVVVAAEGIPWFAATHGTFHALAHQIAPVVPGLLCDFALLALFGVGIGVLVKNQVAGVLLTIGGTLVVETIILALFRHLLHIDLNWLPNPAAASLAGGIFGRTGGTNNVLLSWWAGALVLVAWGAIPAVIGYFTTFRRDVT